MAKPCCFQIDIATGGTDWKANVCIEDDDVRQCSLSTKKQRARRVDVSLTVFVSSPGAVVLFVLVVTAGLDGSFGLPTIIITTAIMAATATKTNPMIMTLNLRDIFDQPCAPLTSGAGIKKHRKLALRVHLVQVSPLTEEEIDGSDRNLAEVVTSILQRSE